MRTIVAIGCAILGASLLSFPAAAQQKTVKACQEEWRANKEANQAKGITEKAYVTQCRAGTAAAAPKPAAAEKKPTAAAATGKTARECRDEWRANKAANQAKGVTEKAYVAQCRTGTAAAQPTSTPMAPPPARSTEAPAPARTANPPPAASAAPTGANQYSTETQAKVRCLGGTVVWANLDSKIYHFSGYKDYGHTKAGAYMCERDATSQGMRAAKNEKHP
ncbi:MAG TPA: hypothetical protein VJR71_13290 [Pseudolabrys sp.]|nr:hypothetical protein [Pseudolabrys sp.]